jgi:GLPGLI family protein
VVIKIVLLTGEFPPLFKIFEMKKLLTLILCIISLNALTQEFIIADSSKILCSYNYQFQEDSTNRNSLKSHGMVLEIGTYCSKFISVNKLFQDSLLFVFKDDPIDVASKKIIPQVMGSRIPPFCNYTLMKSYPKKGATTTTAYFNKTHFKVTEKQSFNWNLIRNRDTTILGLPCKFATTKFAGRTYRAWYTLDIPVSDGPYKFGGLPGLIVSIADTQDQHRFDLTGIEKRCRKIFFLQNVSVDVSAEEYVKAIYLNISQLYNRIQNNDGITPANDESKADALNRLKSRNNFIEIY